MKTVQTKIFAIALLLLAAGLACRKNDHPAVDEPSRVAEAKAFYQKVMQKESDLLDKSYTELPKHSTRRKFARMKGLSDLFDWNTAMEFGDKAESFLIVPIEGKQTPFMNKKVEAKRFGIFFNDSLGLPAFRVMELVSKNGGTFSADMRETAAAVFTNITYKQPDATDNLTALVNVYDDTYSLLKSYQFSNGNGKLSTNGISNRIGRPKQRPVPVMIGRTTCGSCQTYYLIGIWYDLETYEIVDSYILDSWDECTQSGAPPSGYGPEPPEGVDPNVVCHQNGVDAFNSFVNDATAVSETEGFDISTISPIKKNKNPKWVVLRGGFGLWHLRSYEKGEIELNSYLNRWEWVSLVHDKVDKVGMSNIGGVVDVISHTGTPSFTAGTPNVLYAGMSLEFIVRYTATPIPCPPFTWIIPPVDVSYTSTGLWDANP